jgi:hypothetical protein
MANQSKRSSGRQPSDPTATETPSPETTATAVNDENAEQAAPPAAAATDAPRPPQPQSPQPKPAPTLNINDLKDMSIQKLTQVAKDLNVAGATGMRKQDLIFQILKAQTELSGFMFSEGVLEVLPTASASCARPITTTCRAQTTSTCRRRRFGSSTCRRAIRIRSGAAAERTASVTSR